MSLNRVYVAGSSVITAADMNGLQAAWTAYTPSWTGTTTNPAIGNGTMVGKWYRQGKTVLFRIVITMGSTTTYGSGVWQLTLPTAPLTSTERLAFMAHFYDNGVGEYGGRAAWTGAVLNLLCDPTTAGNAMRGVGATAPFTFGVGDQVDITGSYEAA